MAEGAAIVPNDFICLFPFPSACVLQGLIEHIEKDQSAMLKLLQRRKQEEIDNSGIVALLKVSDLY